MTLFCYKYAAVGLPTDFAKFDDNSEILKLPLCNALFGGLWETDVKCIKWY